MPGKEAEKPSIDLTVNFAFNSAKIEGDALIILKSLGEALKDTRLSKYRFQIAGHTDAKGSEEYNRRLSEERAKSVRDHLVFFYDIGPDRISSIGYGKSKLALPNDPENALNRRVQIVNQSADLGDADRVLISGRNCLKFAAGFAAIKARIDCSSSRADFSWPA